MYVCCYLLLIQQELIRKERARELQEQRMAEELSAGALKELGAGLRNQA